MRSSKLPSSNHIENAGKNLKHNILINYILIRNIYPHIIQFYYLTLGVAILPERRQHVSGELRGLGWLKSYILS